MYSEFQNLTGLNVSYDEYEAKVEPMYMACDLNQSDFCDMYRRSRSFEMSLESFLRLYSEGACNVILPEGVQDAYEVAVFSWEMPWRKVRRTLEVMVKLSNAARKDINQYIIYDNDPQGRIGCSDLNDIQGDTGYLYLLTVLDNLDSWGGEIGYGSRAVRWSA